MISVELATEVATSGAPHQQPRITRAMAVKEFFHDLRPLPLYVMLTLTLAFFGVELVVSHITHALTLLVDSYHTLCNLIALVGCLITIKYGAEKEHASLVRGDEQSSDNGSKISFGGECPDESVNGKKSKTKNSNGKSHSSSSERRLRNTFGWARVEVLVMLIGAVFLASLCFSLVVEALQTLCHIGHSDEMHHPGPVMIVGFTGLLLNALCYILIGGYTFHQGSLLHVTASGNVVLEGGLSHEAVRQGGRRLSARRVAAMRPTPAVTSSECQEATAVKATQQVALSTNKAHAHTVSTRQGPLEMLRDVIGCILVVICAAVVMFTEQGVAKYVDPLFSIFSAVCLLGLSLPYMRESGRILLQTIPEHLNIESLKSELKIAFPSLVNVHELHIWRLTPTRVFATAHLVLRSHQDYVVIKETVVQFFHSNGITHVTIQPEFCQDCEDATSQGQLCFLKCGGGACAHDGHCCSAQSRRSSGASNTSARSDEGLKVSSTCHAHAHSHQHNNKDHKHIKNSTKLTPVNVTEDDACQHSTGQPKMSDN